MQNAQPKGPEFGPVRHCAYSLSGDGIFWAKRLKSTRKSFTFDKQSRSQDLMYKKDTRLKLEFWALGRPPVPKVYKTKHLVRGTSGQGGTTSPSKVVCGCTRGRHHAKTYIKRWGIRKAAFWRKKWKSCRNGQFIHFPYVICMPLAAWSEKATVKERPWVSLNYSQWSIWAILR